MKTQTEPINASRQFCPRLECKAQGQIGQGNIVKPRDIPHTFWNAGKEPARLLEIISPAGFEQYFAEVAEVLQRGGPRDMGKMAEIANRYGITYEMSWVPELAAKYHLKPPR